MLVRSASRRVAAGGADSNWGPDGRGRCQKPHMRLDKNKSAHDTVLIRINHGGIRQMQRDDSMLGLHEWTLVLDLFSEYGCW